MLMDFDSRLDAIPPVALAIDAFCRQGGLGESMAYRMQLAAVEAMNNVVLHSYDGQPGHTAVIAVRLKANGLTIEVRHRGRPMPHGCMRPLPDPISERLEDLPESGRGLQLIHSIMDSTSCRSKNGLHSFIMRKALPA